VNLLVKNGRVVDPARKLDSVTDVLIVDGKIRSIGKRANADFPQLDANGLIVAPLATFTPGPKTTFCSTVTSGAISVSQLKNTVSGAFSVMGISTVPPACRCDGSHARS